MSRGVTVDRGRINFDGERVIERTNKHCYTAVRCVVRHHHQIGVLQGVHRPAVYSWKIREQVAIEEE